MKVLFTMITKAIKYSNALWEIRRFVGNLHFFLPINKNNPYAVNNIVT